LEASIMQAVPSIDVCPLGQWPQRMPHVHNQSTGSGQNKAK